MLLRGFWRTCSVLEKLSLSETNGRRVQYGGGADAKGARLLLEAHPRISLRLEQLHQVSSDFLVI